MAMSQSTGRIMTLRIEGDHNKKNVLPCGVDIKFEEMFLEYYEGSVEVHKKDGLGSGGTHVWVSSNNFLTCKYYGGSSLRQVYLMRVSGGNCRGWTFRDSDPIPGNQLSYKRLRDLDLTTGGYDNPTCGHLINLRYAELLPTGQHKTDIWLNFGGKHQATMTITE